MERIWSLMIMFEMSGAVGDGGKRAVLGDGGKRAVLLETMGNERCCW